MHHPGLLGRGRLSRRGLVSLYDGGAGGEHEHSQKRKEITENLGFHRCAGFAGSDFTARIESCAHPPTALRTENMIPDEPTTRTEADEPEAVDHLTTPEQTALELSGEMEHASGPEWERLSKKSDDLTDADKQNGDRG